jgi:putative membrane protein
MVLDKAQMKRVEDTIAAIEQRSAAEVVVCVVPRADDYAQARASFALVLTLLCAWAAIVAFPLWPLYWVILGQGVIWIAFYLVAGWGPLLRVLVPARVRNGAVLARTQQLFIERGVTETRDRSGVLILIAAAEHQVRVLGDRGIHAQLGADGWREHLAPLLVAMQQGRAADGLVRFLEELGEILTRHFPVRQDDTDELPNAVQRGD